MMSKDVRAQIEATPADQRKVMFEFVTEMSTSMKVKVVKETKTGGVTLTVDGTSGSEKSTIFLTLRRVAPTPEHRSTPHS